MWFSRKVLGTLLNALGILAGGSAALFGWRQVSSASQAAVKVLLGAFTVWVGLSTTWRALHGSLGQMVAQFAVAVLALMLGHATGKLLRIQTSLNRLGHFAKEQFNQARPGQPLPPSAGFVTCAILYCATPLAILGPLLEGLAGNWQVLAIKSVMDGFAALAFAGVMGWGVLGSVIPVLALQGTVALLARSLASAVTVPAILDSISAAGGLIVFSVSLVILELKKVDLADYLPALLYAPLLAWWLL